MTRREQCSFTTWAAKDSRFFRLLNPPWHNAYVTQLFGYFAAPHNFALVDSFLQVPATGKWVSASLHTLIRICKYELITDQLAELTNNPNVTEKLLMSADDLTLAEAMKIAFQLESAAGLALQIACSSPSLLQPCFWYRWRDDPWGPSPGFLRTAQWWRCPGTTACQICARP